MRDNCFLSLLFLLWLLNELLATQFLGLKVLRLPNVQRLATLFVSVKIINLEREPNRIVFTFFPRKNHKRTEKTVKQATTQLTKTVITIHHSVELIFVSFVFTWNCCWKINQLWLHKMFNSLSFSLSLQSRRIADNNEGQSNEIVSLTHLVFKIQCQVFQLVLFLVTVSNVFLAKNENKVIVMGVTVDRSGDSMTENPTNDPVRHTDVNPICR